LRSETVPERVQRDEGEFADERFEPVARVKRLRPLLPFLGLLVASVLARLWIGRQTVGPWYVIDEFRYAEYAERFAEGGPFTDLLSVFPGLYPRLLALPYTVFDSAGTAYAAAKALNAVLMTLAAVPVFLWARRLVPRRLALLTAGLVLLLPSLLYSGMLVTENAFFPAFVAALYVIALVLERPMLLRQALVVAAVGLAAAVRLQAVVLLAVLPTALALKLLFDVRAGEVSARGALRSLRRYAPLGAVLLATAVVYLVTSIAQGSSLTERLGVYGGLTQVDYSLRDTLRWIVLHAADLSLLVALVPVSAFLVLLTLALRRGTLTTPAERAFLGVTAAAVFWVVIQVAVYASRFAERIEERNMFHVAPLLLLAFVLWLARGLPRPATATALAAVAPLALLVTLPLDELLVLPLLSDTFSLVPFYDLTVRGEATTHEVELLLAGGAVMAAIVFAILPRRVAATAAPLVVAGGLVLISAGVYRATTRYAAQFRVEARAGDDVSWIDRRIGPDADGAFLYTGHPDPTHTASVILQTAFWNRSLEDVLELAPLDLCCLAQEEVRLEPDGRVVDANGASPDLDYIGVDRTLEVGGQRLGETAAHALYRVQQPLRLASRWEGLYVDGWMGETAAYSRFSSPRGRAGRVRVTFTRVPWPGPFVASTATVVLGRTTKTVSLTSDERRSVTLPAPPPPFRVELRVTPTFSPAQFGTPDARQLGARPTIRYLPR
jgi:hypothetical protein